MPEVNLTQRQFLTLYRLAQFGFATRDDLMHSVFFDMADPVQKYREHIVPITKGEGRATGNPDLILKFKNTDFLYIGESGLSALHESLPQNRSYNLRMLPNPRNVKSNRNLDEYAGLAPVFAKFCQLEGGQAQIGPKRFTIERVEVYCKPDDLQFYAEGKNRQIKPDGLVILYRRDAQGILQFDWLYLEYEETSSPAKKLDTLREYARFYWSGEFKRLFNTQYRHNYELSDSEVQNPRFRTLIFVANSEGFGYLDGVLAELRFSDIGVDYKQLGFPSDRMGLHQFLFCQREAFVTAEHALASVWLNAANYCRDKRRVACVG